MKLRETLLSLINGRESSVSAQNLAGAPQDCTCGLYVSYLLPGAFILPEVPGLNTEDGSPVALHLAGVLHPCLKEVLQRAHRSLPHDPFRPFLGSGTEDFPREREAILGILEETVPYPRYLYSVGTLDIEKGAVVFVALQAHRHNARLQRSWQVFAQDSLQWCQIFSCQTLTNNSFGWFV